MGIPSYFAHVLKKYPHVIKRLSELPCIHNLYMDCNGMIYDVVRQMQYTPENTAAYEAELLQRICDSIDACIAIMRPVSRVFLAFDGVAPVAKLNQQRERRYKSWYLGEMEAQRRRDHAKQGTRIQPPKPAWNTSAITPGTKFMNALHDKLAEHYDASQCNLNGVSIMVSSSKEPGEGEHKLFEYIREHAAEHAGKNTVIYGLDADLIMLCMSHLHISRGIYLYRETPEFVKSINVALDEKERYYMDIPEFADAIWGAQRHGLAVGTSAPHTPNGALIPKGGVRSAMLGTPREGGVRGTVGSPMDYIFMCFMLGNDFMPHFPALNIRTTGIASLMEAYRATIGADETIIQTTSLNEYVIHWPKYKKLVAYLAAQELTLIRKEHATRDRQARHVRDSDTEDDVMHDVLMLPMTQRDVERGIDPFHSGWERRYYATMCDIHGPGNVVPRTPPPNLSLQPGNQGSPNRTAIDALCRNYLEGMEWTFRYYTRGCVDWKWSYANHYPPLLADLVQHIPETHDPTNAFSFLSVKPKEPIRDVVQLCYVLPRASHALLPPTVQRALMRSKLASKYTDDGSPDFKWAYCKYFWECHTDLPALDLRELEAIVDGNLGT
jgi:5'-3' exonuclease